MHRAGTWINSREGQIEKLLRAQASTNDKYYTAVLERVEAQQPTMPAETVEIPMETAGEIKVSAEEEIVQLSVSPRHPDKDYYLSFASWGGRYEKQKDLEFALELSLPICKKQVFQAIQEQMKALSEQIPCRQDVSPEPVREPEHLPQSPKSAPQSTQNTPAVNYATPIPKAREIARKRHYHGLGANRFTNIGNVASTLPTINTHSLTVNSPPQHTRMVYACCR